MKLSRRNFFRAAAASPIAMRQVAGEVAAGSVGLQLAGAPMGGDCTASGPTGESPYQMAHNKVTEWVRTKQIPEWQMVAFRRQARYRARFLDADLLTMRSLSDAAKYRLQEDRELERVCAEHLESDANNKGWDSLYKSFRDRVFS